jgi:hypothetical protein
VIQPRTIVDPEHEMLTETVEEKLISIEEMEQRLAMQAVEGCLADASLCVWFACTDVCPPGG